MGLDNVDNVIVSRHALERYYYRHPDPSIKSGFDAKNIKRNEKATKAIRKILKRGIFIEFSKEHKVKRLLSNGFEDVDYLFSEGWIFVVSKNDPRVVITIERQEGRAFGRDLFEIKTCTES